MFVEIIQNVVDPPGARHAALSHTSGEHSQNLLLGDLSPVDEACEHAEIAQHGPIHRISVGTSQGVWNAMVEKEFTRCGSILVDSIKKIEMDYGLVDLVVFRRWPRLRHAPSGVELSFFGLAAIGLIVSLTPPVGRLAAMMFAAAKRAAQVLAPLVPMIG